MHRFYVPDFVFGRDLQLPSDEAEHLSRVLRLKTGDTITIFDGKGGEASAKIVSISGGTVTVRAGTPSQPPPEPKIVLTLAQALLKSDKMDDVLRDAAMLGVAAIQPFMSVRTDVPKAALRTGVRKQRWARTVLSSVKQSGRAVVPPVYDVVDFRELLRRGGFKTRLMLVEPSAAASSPVPLTELRNLDSRPPSSTLIIVGPEGGWDPAEIASAASAGITLVTMGRRTLRADAAAAVVIPVVQYIYNDL